MNATVTDVYHVENDPDLWRVQQWAHGTDAKIRVIQTVVGPYGAIDQSGGTSYFDIGDTVVQIVGKLLIMTKNQYDQHFGEATNE